MYCIQNQATDLARSQASLSKTAHGNLVASSSDMGGGIYVKGLFMQVGGPSLQSQQSFRTLLGNVVCASGEPTGLFVEIFNHDFPSFHPFLDQDLWSLA